MSAFGAFGQPQQQQQQAGQTGGLFGGGFGSTQNTTGGSLFGNTQQPQQQQQQGSNTGGGLFGATNTNTQAGTTGGGLFGSTQQSGGGLFGSTANNQQQSGGGLFGGSGQQGANTSAPAGGLFGSAPTGQSGDEGGVCIRYRTRFLVRSTVHSHQPSGTTGGGLFGNTNTGNSLFGNTATNPQSAPSGGLFGSTTAAPNTGGGGLFGSTTGNTGGGLFGNTNTNQTAPSGGLFGSTTAAPATGGGIFGSTTTAPATGGLFGSTNTNQAPSTGLFGSTQPQQQQQQQQAGGLFGQQKPATGGLFGGSTLGSSTLGTSALGGSTFLGMSRAPVAPSPQQDAQIQFMQLVQRMEGITQGWNSNSPQCRFQHYFYNLVDPAQVHLYGRPPNASNDALWQKAVRENPDPSCFVPVLATSFDDLQKRVEAQTQQAAAHQEKIKDLQTRIAALTQRHQLSNASRLQRASALQTQLTHRVLKLVQHLHLLIPALRSSALRPEEEALRTALEEIDEEVRRPGGTGRIRGKLNELWALVGAVSAARERGRAGGGVEWAVVDEEGLAQIAQILAEEQAGLAHLTKLLQKDMKDLAVIQGSSPQEEDPDSLMSSTTTLRASTL
ncbi:hypothetical protein L227DRAFT_501697 [Lentinus tigrinus ALCF2SS1-6]|uniref:Nucleoporin Nup54 alpha-helical domain-containing protein n=1 Tax=Lentinus tigrinus ALCF2SS1-6 TaxID=1328759 RepID=A0A5C2SA03_9APHY|nr:hypothetical protein L227DRAFT_501697 [Lentinus tigrinus ALCF2SS1-6]